MCCNPNVIISFKVQSWHLHTLFNFNFSWNIICWNLSSESDLTIWLVWIRAFLMVSTVWSVLLVDYIHMRYLIIGYEVEIQQSTMGFSGMLSLWIWRRMYIYGRLMCPLSLFIHNEVILVLVQDSWKLLGFYFDRKLLE